MDAVSTCTNFCSNRVVETFISITSVSRFFGIVGESKTKFFIPQVYFARPDLLLAPLKGKIRSDL